MIFRGFVFGGKIGGNVTCRDQEQKFQCVISGIALPVLSDSLSALIISVFGKVCSQDLFSRMLKNLLLFYPGLFHILLTENSLMSSSVKNRVAFLYFCVHCLFFIKRGYELG